MYAHLFKVVKRKNLSPEDIEILCKHGNVKNKSGENLLHHYLRFNPHFDRDVADRLREACGFHSTLRDGETIMESIFYMDDEFQEEKMQWLLDFPEAYIIRRDFIFEYLSKMHDQLEERQQRYWKTHSLDKMFRPFSQTEIAILQQFVEKGILNTEYTIAAYENLLHPGYFVQTWKDYNWFMETLIVNGLHTGLNTGRFAFTSDPKSIFAGPKDSDLILHLFNALSHRFKNPLYALYDIVRTTLHYQPYDIVHDIWRRSQSKIKARWIFSSFVFQGYSDLAVQNLEKLICSGDITEADVQDAPAHVLRGILHGPCDIWINSNETWIFLSFHDPTKFDLGESSSTTESSECKPESTESSEWKPRTTKSSVWKPFTNKDGKPCTPMKDTYSHYKRRPTKDIVYSYIEARGPLPNAEAIATLRQMWIKLSQGINAQAEEDVLKGLLKKDHLPWRKTVPQSSTMQDSVDPNKEIRVPI